MVQFEDRFPAGGTNFNFTIQAGLGLTYQVSVRAILMDGVRWLHFSNATRRGSDRNPGFDGARIYAGVMIPF